MRRTRVPETCEFPTRNRFFDQKRPFRLGPEGGAPRGSAAAAGFSEGGSKTPKTLQKWPISGPPLGNFQSKPCFYILGPSEPDLRTFFAPPGSAICAPGRAKRRLSKTPLPERASRTKTKKKKKNTVFLQVFLGRAGFRGVKNAKNW